jgi:lipid-A-disaccharide synthase
MKYYLIAGEASGDLHGANLMKAIRRNDPDAEFRFFGGDLMKAEGGDLIKHYSEMAYMGFQEVLLNLRVILRNMREAKKDVLEFRPDALILVDFPGFNLKIAEFAKKQGIAVYYYISPKVWAWNQKRVLKIRKVVDHLFCILPFEVDFYRSWGMEVHYVGNPILDAIAAFQPDPGFRVRHGLEERPIIALLPGSRKQEIQKILPVMLETAARFPGYQFVIAGAPGFGKDFYRQFQTGSSAPVVFNDTYNLLSNAHAAVVTSGTATLETALFRVPEVVVYRTSAISVAIARLVIRIRFISLVNLIMDRLVVRELIQEECTAETICNCLGAIIAGGGRESMLADYAELAVRMGEPGASEKTAALIQESLK